MEAAERERCRADEIAGVAEVVGGPDARVEVAVDGGSGGDADGTACGPEFATSGAAESADSRIATPADTVTQATASAATRRRIVIIGA